MNAIDRAADALVGLIIRTRFRNPGTSSDPYADALILWVSVVSEARNLLAENGIPESALSAVEQVYRDAVESWLRGDESETDDAELFEHMRDVLDPPIVCIHEEGF